eukprot:762616-Hanusia_phi.AAC.2
MPRRCHAMIGYQPPGGQRRAGPAARPGPLIGLSLGSGGPGDQSEAAGNKVKPNLVPQKRHPTRISVPSDNLVCREGNSAPTIVIAVGRNMPSDRLDYAREMNNFLFFFDA